MLSGDFFEYSFSKNLIAPVVNNRSGQLIDGFSDIGVNGFLELLV
jgi:hypothetical protein